MNFYHRIGVIAYIFCRFLLFLFFILNNVRPDCLLHYNNDSAEELARVEFPIFYFSLPYFSLPPLRMACERGDTLEMADLSNLRPTSRG